MIREHPERVGRVLEMVRINGVTKTLAAGAFEARIPDTAGIQLLWPYRRDGGRCGAFCAWRLGGLRGDGLRFTRRSCRGAGQSGGQVAAGMRSAASGRHDRGGRSRCRACRRADLRLGETAAVLGLGLLGQIALQLLRASGARAMGFDANHGAWKKRRRWVARNALRRRVSRLSGKC